MKDQKLEQASNIFFAVGVAIFIICINISILAQLMPFDGWKIYENFVSWRIMLRACLLAPILEEFIFRYLPIKLAAKASWFKDDKESQYILIGLIACLFGYMHGGISHILVQGVAGFAFGWVYLKNSMSYWSAVIAHSLYNIMICVIFPSII